MPLTPDCSRSAHEGKHRQSPDSSSRFILVYRSPYLYVTMQCARPVIRSACIEQIEGMCVRHPEAKKRDDGVKKSVQRQTRDT